MKESLHDIGKAIERHIEKEKASYTRIPAIGRACCLFLKKVDSL